ncbi:hypothetical protein [Roseomonas sp. BN140053]|uniref:hypothetical protein n=1 Tax=Roseomonas sp. BN140053 TaxID=3391898 RepID=UPI0039E8551E
MFAFLLRPIRQALRHPSWSISRFCGECLVFAHSATAARRFADGAFVLPLWPEAARSTPPAPPWSQCALVDVQEVARAPGEAEGEVLTQNGLEAARPVAEAPVP